MLSDVALIAKTPMDKGFEAMYEGMRAKCSQTFFCTLRVLPGESNRSRSILYALSYFSLRSQCARRTSEGLLAEVGEVGQRFKTIFVAYLRDSTFGIEQIVEDAFLSACLHPFVYGFVKYVIEDATKCADGVSAQMGKFFYRLHVLVVLKDEVLEGAGIFGKWMHQAGKIVIGIVVAQHKGELFPL